MDDVHGEVVVGNEGGFSIAIYALTASGDTPPLRTLSVTFDPLGLFVDVVHNEIVVADGVGSNVYVFARTATGSALPIRHLSGAATLLAGPFDVSVDTVHDELVVANEWNSSVTVYPRTANGNTAPLRTLAGPDTGLCRPESIAVDTISDELVVGNTGWSAGSSSCPQSVTVYDRTASGDAAPLGTLLGGGVGEVLPVGLFVDVGRNELVVANANAGGGVTAYGRNAIGNSPPIHQLPESVVRAARDVFVRDTAKTVTLNAVASGFYSDAGTHEPHNYAVGWYVPGKAELRDYFVFDMSAFTGTILTAALRLSPAPPGFGRLLSQDPSETYTLFDVSTALATLTGGSGGVAAFGDLGSGTSYGSLVATSLLGSTVDIPLNPTGIAFLAASSGRIAIGGAITTLAKGTTDEALFNATSASQTRQLVITTR